MDFGLLPCSRRAVMLLAVLLIVCAPVLLAQSAGTSGLGGTITDPSGAAIPNVTVTITSNDTGQTRTTTTGPDGVYKFTLLQPGSYKIRFAAAGFKTSEIGAVTLNVTETPELSRTLEVGAQSEQVTVEATAETLQTQSSTLGTTVGTKTVSELPLASRNYTQIIGLSAGAAMDVNNATYFGKGTQDMSVNGNDPGQNNFQMDGVAVNNMANRGSSNDGGIYAGIGIPNPDAIQEFKIQTSTYDSSYGRNPGANVNVVTKSGTNAWHGTAFEFFRNAQMNANDFFYNRDNPNSKSAKQVLNQNQFGGVLGGPIKKDKLFIFGSYQGTRSRNGVAGPGNSGGLLLPPIPDGDRSGPNDASVNPWLAQVIADNCHFPTFGPPLSCSANSVSGPGYKTLQLKTADGSYYFPSVGNFPTLKQFSNPAVANEDQVIINGDYLVSPKNTLAMRYFYTHDPRTLSFNSVIGGSLPGAPEKTYNSNTNSSLKLTTLFSNNFVNEVRASFQRNLVYNSDQLPAGDSPANLGLKPIVPTQTQAPPISLLINGFGTNGFLEPSYSPSNQIQYADQISWSHGRHTIRAGFEYEFTQWNLVFGGLQRGWMLMGSFSDLLSGQAGNILQCLFCVRSSPQGIIHAYREPNMNSFVQDDWKVNSKLTVNIGVRWEYDGVLSDKFGNLTNKWLSLLAPNSALPTAQVASPGISTPAAYQGYVVPNNFVAHHGQPPAGVHIVDSGFSIRKHPPYADFGPRIGFAYQLTSKLVVRGGAGIFYDRVGADRFVHSVEEGNPYAATISYGPGNPFTIDAPYPDTPQVGEFAQRWANPATLQTSALNHVFLTDTTHTPLIRQYNVNFQYEFAPRWVLEAGYVGSSGINLTDYNHNYNVAGLASPSNPINGLTTNDRSNILFRVPYLGFQPTGLQGTAYDGHSFYNSLQLTVRKSFSHGVTLQAAYTWSKALTNIFDSTANSNLPTNLAQQYGPANFDRPQRFVINYSWDLPFGKHTGAAARLLEGWSLSGVTTVQNGLPITPIDTRGGTAFGTTTTTIESGYSRPQMCPGFTYGQTASSGGIESRLGGNSGGDGYFNFSSFCAPPVAPFSTDGSTLFGNAGVGFILGPGQFNFDASLLKTTRVTERTSIQFRAEFFNLFNHPQFALPGQAGPIAPGTGTNIAATAPGAGGVIVHTAGWITSTSVNPRIIQLALKFIF
jgi:hypothetical protein